MLKTAGESRGQPLNALIALLPAVVGSEGYTTLCITTANELRVVVMVQWLAHLTCNPGDAGSIPTYGIKFFFQAEDGIRDRSPSRGLGDVYKRQRFPLTAYSVFSSERVQLVVRCCYLSTLHSILL